MAVKLDTGGGKKPPVAPVTPNGTATPIPGAIPAAGGRLTAPKTPPVAPPPAAPPVKALIPQGITASMPDINATVQKTVDAHMQKFGTKPSPGLMYDVVRGWAGGIFSDPHQLFDVPLSPQEAHVKQVATSVDIRAPEAGEMLAEAQGHALTPQQVVAIKMAKGEMTVPQSRLYLQQAGVLPTLQEVHDVTFPVLKGIGQISHSIKDFPFAIEKLSIAAGKDAWDTARWPGYLLNQTSLPGPAKQIVGVLPFFAPGEYTSGKPGSPTRTGKLLYQAQKQIIYDFEHPYDRPGYLALDLFAVLSAGAGTYARLASGISRAAEVGDVTRVASVDEASTALERYAAAREATPHNGLMAHVKGTPPGVFDAKEARTVIRALNKAKENGLSDAEALKVIPARLRGHALGEMRSPEQVLGMAKAFAKEVIHKPYHEPYRVGFGANAAYVPTFDNAILRWMQIGVLKKMNRAMEEAPEAAFSAKRNSRLYDHLFSPQVWTKRWMDNNQLIDIAIETAPAHELTRLTNWQSRAQSVRAAIAGDKDMGRAWKSMNGKSKLAMGKLIQMVFTEDPNPAQVWRSFHEGEIADAQGVIEKLQSKTDEEIESLSQRNINAQIKNNNRKIKNHEAQLEALDAGLAMLDNPNLHPRIQKIIDKTYEVSDLQEKIKTEVLGYDHQILGRHNSEVAAILRGEKIAYGEHGEPLGVVTPGSVEDALLKRGTKAAATALRKEKRKLDRLEKNMLAPSKKTGVVKDRPSLRARIDEQRTAVDAATDNLLVARHHEEILGSRVIPLNVHERDNFLENANFDEDIEGLRKGRGTGYVTTRTASRPEDLSGFQRLTRIGRGKYGLSKPRVTVYRMTGTALHFGDTVMDTSEALTSELHRVVRAGAEMERYNKLWASATTHEDFVKQVGNIETADLGYMKPIRDIRNVPKHLKETMDALLQQKTDRKRIAELEEEGISKVRDWMYPKLEEVMKTKDPHVRWMDERYFMDAFNKQHWVWADRIMSNAFAPINSPFRTLMIFGTPAYLLNAVGAAGTLLTKQGFLAIPNLGRSFASSHIYGGEVSRLLDTLAGSTLAQAFVTEKNIFTKGDQAIASAWQRATDLYFRRAAVIGRLREAGLMKDHLSTEDILKELNSEENRIKVRQAAQLSRQDMLDFEKMTWPERATLRHLIFVYAFMRAGSIYSLRWLLEHPIQADVLAHVGQDRVKEIERLVGKTPAWYTNSNYFPIGHDTTLNGVQVNIPDTLNQIAYPVASIFGNVPYESPTNLVGPAVNFGFGALTGQRLGAQGQALPKRYTGPLQNPVNSFLDLLSQTPPGVNLRQKPGATQLAPAPVSSGVYDPVSAAHSQEAQAVKLPTMESDQLWNGWGQVIFRSALPRHPNQAGMAARYWRDLRTANPDAYWKHQVDLVHQMVARQATVLGERVPREVLDAVNLVANRERYVDDQKKKWEQKNHQPLDKVGDRQLAAWTIDFLRSERIIDEGTARRYRSDLNQAADSRQAKIIWQGALRAHGAKPWETWVQRADAVDWYAHASFADTIQSLKERGLGDYQKALTAPQETKWAYGRKAQAYADGLADFQHRMDSAEFSSTRTEIAVERRQFIDDQDKEATINGVTFPSPVRVKFSRLSPQAQQAKLMNASNGSWQTLDSFTKELLTGKKPSSDVDYGYRNLTHWVDIYKRDHLGHTAPGWLKAGYVKYLSQKLPAFGRDYAFSQLPRAGRMDTLKPFTSSPNADTWHQLFKLASDRYTSLKKASFTQTDINDQWKVYDLPKVMEWLNAQSNSFQLELARWQKSHPNFLRSLVTR